MMDVAACPIYITLGSRNLRGPEGTQTGRIRNILISNVVATGVDKMSGVQITGARPGHNIEGVRLENIRLVVFGRGGTKEGRRPSAAGVGQEIPGAGQARRDAFYGLLRGTSATCNWRTSR